MTRRMFFAAGLSPLSLLSPTQVTASLPVRPWSYWRTRRGIQTGMQQPGHQWRPVGMLTTPRHPSQLVWRHR